MKKSKLFQIDEELWNRFRAKCIQEKVRFHDKLAELIQKDLDQI